MSYASTVTVDIRTLHVAGAAEPLPGGNTQINIENTHIFVKSFTLLTIVCPYQMKIEQNARRYCGNILYILYNRKACPFFASVKLRNRIRSAVMVCVLLNFINSSFIDIKPVIRFSVPVTVYAIHHQASVIE